MARANRLCGQGGIFHVTHRCHHREFLLRFARDRDTYRERLREHLIAEEQVKRELCWTEGVAVGSAGFVERVKPLILSRQETEMVQLGEEGWVLQERPHLTARKQARKERPLN